MSDFKRKIEIVESTTPPSNKFNWWFDLNDGMLKRWNGSEWDIYDYTWPKMPYNVANNEILFTVDNFEASSISLSELKTEFNSWGKVKEIRQWADSQYELELYCIVFEKDLTTIDVSNRIEQFASVYSTIDIYFPSSLTDIKSQDWLFACPLEAYMNLHFPNLKSFSGKLYSDEYSTSDIYIYSKTVPQIDYNFIQSWGHATTVHVPSALRNKYQNNTNWTQYNIQSID